ncbi:radical SAM protein [Candidatus Desantisbacteria bacterium]|nr:radical SAM protein [Candidatus Desantisbacteria bacterium]
MNIILKNLTTEELCNQIKPLGGSLYLARKIQTAALCHNDMLKHGPGISGRVLVRVRESCVLPQLKMLDRIESSKDRFVRYVFEGESKGAIEAVRIPLLHRHDDYKYVVCVSSQIGCPMGCAFCFTGKMGFVRNLSPWEIVDQVVQIAGDSQYPVKGVVFMGMGEPMLNYDAVMKAAGILCEPCGMAISSKAITISTSGIVPGIKRFIEDKKKYRLIVSLTSANPAIRLKLMPVEKKWSTDLLMESLREYHKNTNERIILSWTLISGVNTGIIDAKELAMITKGLPVKIDLIDVNDPEGKFNPPSNEELNFFRDALRRELAMPVSRRYSGGADIKAGCGMLASHFQN